MFYFHDHTPCYGWRVDDHRIHGPCGYSQRLNDHITSSLLRYGKMSDSAILSRVGIVQNYRGKKRLAVEGSPFWDEACLNTEGMNNPLPLSTLQRGQRYLSNKGEDFVWLGEVYVKSFPTKEKFVVENGEEKTVRRCRVTNKTILARIPSNPPYRRSEIKPVNDDFTVVRHLGDGVLRTDIRHWTGGEWLASTIVSMEPIPRKKAVVITPTTDKTTCFTLNGEVYLSSNHVNGTERYYLRHTKLYRANGWDNLERVDILPAGEIIPVTVEFVYGQLRTKVSALAF